MDQTLTLELDRAHAAATRARALAEAARAAGVSGGEAARRQREIDRLEDLGRSAVLECLEQADLAQALAAARGMAGSLEDEAERAARSLVLARRPRAEGP
jgi:truncated hemoglobin YjbI